MVDPSREDEEQDGVRAEAAPEADEGSEEAVETAADDGADQGADEGAGEGAGEGEGAEEGDDAAHAEGEAESDAGADEHTQPGKTAPSAGTLLREARESRSLALEDLARTLNLHPRIVTALEADDVEALPAAPFVRGYLRSYARLMGMDPAPLLADHERRAGGVVVEVHATPRLEEPVESPGFVHKRPGTIMVIATIGFVAVVVGALLLLRPDAFRAPAEAEVAPAPTETRPAASSQPRRAPDPTPAVPVIEPVLAPLTGEADAASDAPDGDAAATQAEGEGATTAPSAEAGASDAPTAVDTTVPADAAADDGILSTRTADGTGLRVYAGGEDHLHFTFTSDCWVEVSDGDDVRVFQDIVRDGEVLDLWGRAPFRIRLGYAPAVELTYNGSRVALRPFTRNDVASLTLGR